MKTKSLSCLLINRNEDQKLQWGINNKKLSLHLSRLGSGMMTRKWSYIKKANLKPHFSLLLTPQPLPLRSTLLFLRPLSITLRQALSLNLTGCASQPNTSSLCSAAFMRSSSCAAPSPSHRGLFGLSSQPTSLAMLTDPLLGVAIATTDAYKRSWRRRS